VTNFIQNLRLKA